MKEISTAELQKQKQILSEIYDILLEQKYDPVRQIVGYLLSEDPTYITDYKNARILISEIDRNILLGDLLRSYLSK